MFPEVDRHFDLIVAENGGVLSSEGVERVLAVPVAKELDEALAERHVQFRRGLVLLACEAHDERAVLAQVCRLGLECQLTRSRRAPHGAAVGRLQGSGLLEALAELGVSRHNTIAMGDAENDHSLLDVSELGVAPAKLPWTPARATTAGSVEELERELRGCDEAVISHHSRDGDLSRWIAAVLRDAPLASAVSAIEADVASGAAGGRERPLRAIHEHYSGWCGAPTERRARRRPGSR